MQCDHPTPTSRKLLDTTGSSSFLLIVWIFVEGILWGSIKEINRGCAHLVWILSDNQKSPASSCPSLGLNMLPFTKHIFLSSLLISALGL